MNKFYIGATPIGGLHDVTKRTLDIVKAADYIVCELIPIVKQTIENGNWETNAEYLEYCVDFTGGSKTSGNRNSEGKSHGSMSVDGIKEKILQLVKDGKTMIYLPERGSVGIEDPGLDLKQFLEDRGIVVELLPGVDSVTSSLLSSKIFPTPESHRAWSFQPIVDLSFEQMDKFIGQYSSSPNVLIFQVHDPEMFDAISLMKKHYGTSREISICMNVSLGDEIIHKSTIGEVLENFDIKKYEQHYTTIVVAGQNIWPS